MVTLFSFVLPFGFTLSISIYQSLSTLSSPHGLQMQLPAMRVRTADPAGTVTLEDEGQHWLLKDQFAFENVGFTKTVGTSIKVRLVWVVDWLV